SWLPADVQALAGRLTTYIAESPKSARAFLKQVGTLGPLQEIEIHTLSADTPHADIVRWLTPIRQQGEIGLVSDAGCPAVADPGARVAAVAHTMGIEVNPWVGPSSILLGLMACGLEGQSFSFHRYPPVPTCQPCRQIHA